MVKETEKTAVDPGGARSIVKCLTGNSIVAAVPTCLAGVVMLETTRNITVLLPVVDWLTVPGL